MFLDKLIEALIGSVVFAFFVSFFFSGTISALLAKIGLSGVPPIEAVSIITFAVWLVYSAVTASRNRSDSDEE